MKQLWALFFLLMSFLATPVHALHYPWVPVNLVMADEPPPDEEEEPDCD